MKASPRGTKHSLLFLERSGYHEETYHTFSYSPLVDDDGVVAGMLCVVVEETERVLSERRLATPARPFGGSRGGPKRKQDVYATLESVFLQHGRDLTFVLACVVAGLQPAGHTGVARADGLNATRFVGMTACSTRHSPRTSFVDAIRASRAAGRRVGGPSPEQPSCCPSRDAFHRLGQDTSAVACLLAGVNPYRPAAETIAFARLVARQVSASLGTVHARSRLNGDGPKARGTRPLQDTVLRQRQSRVPHSPHPHYRPAA